MSAMDENFWDERYRSADQVWSGRPNATLVSVAGGLTPEDIQELAAYFSSQPGLFSVHYAVGPKTATKTASAN